jgi:DNA processing protein
MLDPRAAAALSALPGALGSHLLATFRSRQPAPRPLSPEVASMADFDLDAALASVLPPQEAAARAARARSRATYALEEAQRLQIVPVPFGAPTYPALLSSIPDPPPMLWVRGRIDVLGAPAVAVVGSRAASPLSLDLAYVLGRDLARHVAVVSGLARGVDAAAHRGALESGTSVAVLGSGTDIIYPSEHRTLADALVAGGALLSECLPGTPPRRDHFPRRNRLISGLSLGVVIVEASPRSGSLITARVALDQGREVMAVPGPVLGDRHRGAHALIRDGAALVESASDVLAVLGFDLGAQDAVGGDSGRPGAPAASAGLLGAMSHGETYDLQRLLAVSGETATDVLRQLLDLELAGLVVRVPGGRFYRPAGSRKDEVVR